LDLEGAVMRKHFAAYYRPTPEEFRALHEGIVSLDANVLLDFYRFSSDTREQFLALLEKLRSRLWLTHQAASEFHKNRLVVIAGRQRALTQAHEGLKQAQQRLEDLYRSPSKESNERWAKVTEAWKTLDGYVSDLERETVKPSSDVGVDRIWGRLTTLFEDRVGEPYSADEYQRLFEVGKDRYAKRIPPGFADTDKPGDAIYGDWLLWRQLLDHAKSENKPIVLVTDEKKEDWWLSCAGRTVSPLPELLAEMASEAGQLFYMYQPDQFLRVIGPTVQQEASGSAIKELQSLPSRAESEQLLVARRRWREIEDLRGRSAYLRQRIAELTDLRSRIATDETTRDEVLKLLSVEAEARADLEHTERRAWDLERALRGQLAYGPTGIAIPSGVPGSVFGESEELFDIHGGTAFPRAGNIRHATGYSMLGDHPILPHRSRPRPDLPDGQRSGSGEE
jgi:hypothetical protein